MSGSTRPISKKTPTWCKYQPEEIEALITKLAKEDNKPSMIGIILRDRYSVPLTRPLLGKKITKVLESSEYKLRIPEDLDSLIKKAEAMKKHHEKNKKDYSTKRALNLIESKVHRLSKYYRSRGILPQDWNYKSVVASVK
jgi:small subunit ribosomal protein S15